MGFRERPEYQEWRGAVFRLFGQKCIRCGYAGNIHAHHVMPVNEYPELVFEPNNGVPLCGNCHTEVKGSELAHVDELKQRQRAILGGQPAAATQSTSTDSVLRERRPARNRPTQRRCIAGSQPQQTPRRLLSFGRGTAMRSKHRPQHDLPFCRTCSHLDDGRILLRKPTRCSVHSWIWRREGRRRHAARVRTRR